MAINVVVFGSGTGTNLKALLDARSSEFPPLYTIKALFTDRECSFQAIAHEYGLPLIHLSFADFFQSKGIQNFKHHQTRLAFDQKIVEILESHAADNQYTIDLIVLAGYMRVLKAPFIQRFRGRILNVHPADLTRLNTNGSRKYVGADAVYEALAANEPRTRSTVIVVDENVDTGEIYVLGPWVEYTEGYPVTKAKAKKHQEKQKAVSDWPAIVQAVKLFAKEGRCVESLEL